MDETASTMNRRAHERVSCEIEDEQAQRICNLSLTGLYLESGREYQPNEILSMSFNLPANGKKVELSGRVTRCESLNPSRFGYGINFSSLEEEATKDIQYALTSERIYGGVYRVFQEILSEPRRSEFRRDASIIRDLHIDSLKVAEISILLEQTFDQSIFLPDWLTSEEDPKNLTVNSLVRFLTDHLRTVN